MGRSVRNLQCFVFLVVAVPLIGCSNSNDVGTPDPTGPGTPDPVHLEPLTPVALAAPATTEITPAPTVRARTESGVIKAGVVVTFDVGSGGTIANTSAVTDIDGVASVGTWTLGSMPGNQIVTARSTGLTSVVFTATAEPGFGAVTGSFRGAGSGYPCGATWTTCVDGERGWPTLPISAASPGHTTRFAFASDSDGLFAFNNLPAGDWTVTFQGLHRHQAIFEGVRLYADTSVAVSVRHGKAVNIPEMRARPAGPFLLFGASNCQFPVPNPPTLVDWGNCDFGSWGGVDVVVNVNGINGTPTAGVQFSFAIPRAGWFAQVFGLPLGEYDVTALAGPAQPGAFCASGTWRLVPWRAVPGRTRIESGVSYVQVDYWCDD